MEISAITSQHEMDKEDCSECGGSIVQTFSDVVCSQCGLVQHKVFVEPHFTIMEVPENQSSSAYVAQGNRPNIADDLGSFIGHYRSLTLRDASGKRLSASKQKRFQRQKKINDLDVHTQGKKREYRALRMLNTLMGVLETSSAIRDDAALLFKKTQDQLEGHVYIAEMIAGAVYLSVRTTPGENLQLKDLIYACENANMRVRSNKVLQAAALIRKLTGRQVKVPQPLDYFEKIFNRLTQDKRVCTRLKKQNLTVEDYSRYLREQAALILKHIKLSARGGRNPYITACAAFVGADILIARIKQNKKIGLVPQKQLAEIMEVAEFTLRDHYLKLIKPVLKEIEPQTMS
ncbi:MAG: hypothetical protein ACFFC7_02590 [Candidatus Hermodarchaeota archaeon]